MKIHFNIHYHTEPGQNIRICGSLKELGNWDIAHAFALNYSLDGHWSASIDIPEEPPLVEYKYVILD